MAFTWTTLAHAEETAESILIANDAQVQGRCEFKCRSVANGYGTTITQIDYKTGKTYCEVFSLANPDQKLDMNADQTNTTCQKELEENLNKELLGKTFETNYKVQPLQYQENEITFSKFMAGFATLDPAFINFETTKNTGQLTLKDNVEIRGQVKNLANQERPASYIYIPGQQSIPLDSEGKPYQHTTAQKIATADYFNKANLAYFSNLFSNMQEIYNYLQNLLFICIGAFFLGAIGTKKIQTYLERNNEQSPSKEPYLHKFYIPLLATGIFFAPIPEDAGMSSTLFQNLVRYFTQQATNIADRASIIGLETYTQKLYATIGAMNAEGAQSTRINYVFNTHDSKYAKQVMKENCEPRHGKSNSMQYNKVTTDEINKIEKIDINKLKGTSKDISFSLCQEVENYYYITHKRSLEYKKLVDAYNNIANNDKLQQRLNNIRDSLQARENELGWISSTIIAPLGFLIENYASISDEKIQENPDNIAKREKNNATQNSQADTIAQAIGQIMNIMPYLMLPGSMMVYQSIHDITEKSLSQLGGILSNVPFIGSTLTYGAKIGGILAGATAAYYSGTNFINMMPLIISALCGAIAFIGYFISLLKFYFISPFVIGFALTTKRLENITEFIILGISIFFRPVLIVIFCHLILFIHTIIKEYFVPMITYLQTTIPLNEIPFLTIINLEMFASYAHVGGQIIATIFIAALILKGPTWTLNLIGLNHKNSDDITGDIMQYAKQKAFI